MIIRMLTIFKFSKVENISGEVLYHIHEFIKNNINFINQRCVCNYTIDNLIRNNGIDQL